METRKRDEIQPRLLGAKALSAYTGLGLTKAAELGTVARARRKV